MPSTSRLEAQQQRTNNKSIMITLCIMLTTELLKKRGQEFFHCWPGVGTNKSMEIGQMLGLRCTEPKPQKPEMSAGNRSFLLHRKLNSLLPRCQTRLTRLDSSITEVIFKSLRIALLSQMDHVLTGPCSGSQEFTLSSQSVSPTLTNMEINGNSKVHPPHSNAKPSARIDSSSTSSSSTRRGDTWPLEDDLWLHAHRSMSVHQLAAHFERNQGAIRSRLKHLRTPEHPACVRLQQEYSTTGRNEVGEIIDRSSSANHKSIKQEEGANRDPGEEQQEQGRQNEEVKKYDEAEADPVDNVMSLSLKQSK